MICIDDVRLVSAAPVAAPAFPTDPIVLENERYRVEVARSNGAISRIRDRVTGTEIITEPRLADNWRISLPIVPTRRREGWRNHEGNYILGRDQRLTSHQVTAAGLDLFWKGPLTSEDGRTWPVRVRMRIAPDREGLSFTLKVQNGTKNEIGEIAYPVIGGLTGIGPTAIARQGTTLTVPAGTGAQSTRPFHTFNNMSWFGVFGPEQHYPYPTNLSMPWISLAGSGTTIYFGSHDPIARLKVFHLEMSPGVTGPRPGGNWPKPDELHGRPAGVRMSWVHIAYHPKGTTFDGPPVFLHSHAGSIAGSARIYGEWLKRSAIKPRPPAPAWKMVPRMPFADLPSQARAARNDGVKVLLLTGWRSGSPKDGDPTLVPDPQLGGDEGLRQAVQECRKLGVAVYVECPINPVSQRTRAFAALKDFVCEDRWGIPYSQLGWSAPRCTAEALSTGERRVWLNAGHAGYRAVLTREMERLAQLGVAGARFVGLFGQPLDFNAGLDMLPDSASWEGVLRTLEAMTEAARRHVPGFAIVLDEPYDFLGYVPVHAGQPPADGSPLAVALESGTDRRRDPVPSGSGGAVRH